MRYYIRTHNGKYEVMDNKTDSIVAIFNDNRSLQNYLAMKKIEEANIDKGIYDPSNRVKKDFSKILKVQPLDITPQETEPLGDRLLKKFETSIFDAPKAATSFLEVKEEVISHEVPGELESEAVKATEPEESLSSEQEQVAETNDDVETSVTPQETEQQADTYEVTEDDHDDELMLLAKKLQRFTKKLIETDSQLSSQTTDTVDQNGEESSPIITEPVGEVVETPAATSEVAETIEEPEVDYSDQEVSEPDFVKTKPKKLSKAERKLLKQQQ